MKDIKKAVLKLTISYKIIGLGSFLGVLSVFMPWYSDFNSLNSGISYLGVTGPLYLLGIVVFLISIMNLGIIASKVFNYKLPNLKTKNENLFIGGGFLATLMIIIAFSIYFHNSFGINILNKKVRIGLIFAFISSISVSFGGIMELNKKNFHKITVHEKALSEFGVGKDSGKALHRSMTINEAIENNQ